MPADRTSTTSSFAEAVLSGQPLSSHGARHAASIARGQACKVCRKRKLKCDGVKPLCGACKKSALAHGDDITHLTCEFDDPTAAKKKRASPGSKVAALEAELAELKALIQQNGIGGTSAQIPPLPSNASTSSASDLPAPPFIDFPIFTRTCDAQDPPYVAPPQAPWHPPPVVLNSPRHGPPTHVTSTHTSGSEFLVSNFNEKTGAFTPPSTNASSTGASPASSSDPFLELLFPGWPNDLPSPDLTMRLVEVWLTRPHICSGMVNAARFRNSMLLPPTSQGFPHKGLLHMMCAMSAMMVGEEFFGGEKYWPAGQTASEYHASRAKLALDSAINNGERLFQVAQTITLLCCWSYTNARFVELWLYCGQATRILTPLGLNHLRSGDDKAPLSGFKPYLLPPTTDPEELRERAMCFYLAFMADRFASGSTGWASGLDDADITTLLPCENVPYPVGAIEENPLSPRSSMFFLAHPPDTCGPLQLVFKCIALWGRVNTFTQRAPHSMSGRTVNAWGLNDPIQDVRATDVFKRLDATVQAFRASIPREHQLNASFVPGAGDIVAETRLCLLHGLSWACTISLHEPYVSSLDEDEHSMKKCLEAARETLGNVFSLLSTSYEISLYSPYINMVWAIAGRTFVRQLGLRMAQGITEGTDEIRNHVGTLLMALKAYKTPLGAASAAQLQFLLDDPLRTLPAAFSFPNGQASAAGADQAERRRLALHGLFPDGPAMNTSFPCADMQLNAFSVRETRDRIAGMNDGREADANAALSSMVEGMAKGATCLADEFYKREQWKASEERLNEKRDEETLVFSSSIAQAVASAGMGGMDSSMRFEELQDLSGAEVTGLETLLGL